MADGARGDIISLYPPLTFSADDIAEAADRLGAAFDEVDRELSG
jgi:4-aminobutyrate aminotransferase-like enzyme